MSNPLTSEIAARPLVLLAGGVPESAATLLGEAGWQVRSAPSAAALRRLAEDAPPQLILLGETEADEPALSLLARLQDDDATRAIPVLFVAGDASGADEELALALGAADCVSLPLRPLVLLARVHAQLRLQRLRRLERDAGRVMA